jgi:hypothetical protein
MVQNATTQYSEEPRYKKERENEEIKKDQWYSTKRHQYWKRQSKITECLFDRTDIRRRTSHEQPYTARIVQ